MNTAKEPDAVQPISSNTLSIHCGPLKYSAAIGVTSPMNVKMIIAGLRPMRSEMAGTMKPQIIVAMPIGATTCPATSGGIPFTTLKNTGKKMIPTRYQEIMNTEMPGHRPPWIPLYQFLMQIPGATIPFGLLLRSSAFLRSGMGFGGCFSDLSLIEGEFDAHVIQPLLDSSDRMHGLARYLRGATWEPVDALATDHRRLAMPVQLVWGADDPTFPVALARAMLEQLPNARMTEIPGAKLLVHEEKPAEVVAAALAFLG